MAVYSIHSFKKLHFLNFPSIMRGGGDNMKLTVYLAGEIHTNWREELKQKADEQNLPLTFVAPQTNHDRSDNVGESILGEQPNNLYKDAAASDINNFRTQVFMQKADIVIALFGEQYRQWNTDRKSTRLNSSHVAIS